MTFETGELHPNTPHLLSDVTELLLITNHYGRKRWHKNDMESLLTSGVISEEEIDDEERESEEEASSAARHDRTNRQIEDLWSQLEYRSKALEQYYPFTMERGMLVLKDGLTPEQRIYRMLLVCSRLRSFSAERGIAQRWAAAFTKLSREAMTGLLPCGVDVRIFDANSEDRRHHYGTDIKDALKVLGEELGAHAILNEEINRIQSASGDAGLDLVATINFADGAVSSYAIFAQCGAQETKWPTKTLDAHPLKISNYFSMKCDPVSIMFIPVCYRNSDGSFCNNLYASGILLADRVRILQLIGWQEKHEQITGSDWFQTFEVEFDAFVQSATM